MKRCDNCTFVQRLRKKTQKTNVFMKTTIDRGIKHSHWESSKACLQGFCNFQWNVSCQIKACSFRRNLLEEKWVKMPSGSESPVPEEQQHPLHQQPSVRSEHSLLPLIVSTALHFTFPGCDGPKALCPGCFSCLVLFLSHWEAVAGWERCLSHLWAQDWCWCWLAVGVTGPVTETDDGTAELASWKWQGPQAGGMLSSSAKLQFCLLWRWDVGEWLPGGRMCFLLSLHFRCQVSIHMSGLLCAATVITCEVPIDLMGRNQEFQTISSWMDENLWLFDKMLFLLNSNISVYSQESSAIH